ncbi:MAG: CDP-diacylglycerol--glycerol-3-phosphate 3-phosphatidyltransferase [Planctomycetota bacterium]
MSAATEGASGGARTREGVFAHWPNRVTAIRFVGALVLFVLLAVHGEGVGTGERARPDTAMAVCFVLFVLVAATDWLDGWLARRGKHVTAFGRIADPFVDKILVLGALIFLTALPWARTYLPSWMVVLVLSREMLVTGIRGYAESQGVAFPADRWGKIKLVVQCIAIGALLGLHGLPWPDVLVRPIEVVAHVSVWATLVSTVGSGVSYVVKSARLLGGTS